jgi:hypothetical protein
VAALAQLTPSAQVRVVKKWDLTSGTAQPGWPASTHFHADASVQTYPGLAETNIRLEGRLFNSLLGVHTPNPPIAHKNGPFQGVLRRVWWRI